VPGYLIEDCRADLMAAVHGGAPRTSGLRPTQGPWSLFLEALAYSFGNLNRLRQPIGAVALIAIGFFAARLTTTAGKPTVNNSDVTAQDDPYHTVRSVQADPE